jgi:UDP-N-acetylmuramoylalanine--D-glutamate ligase
MNKRMVILGGGESGVGAALLAKKTGHDVFLFDESSLKVGYRTELHNENIAFAEKEVDEQLILNATEVVKSPGIPEENKWVQKIRVCKYSRYQ